MVVQSSAVAKSSKRKPAAKPIGDVPAPKTVNKRTKKTDVPDAPARRHTDVPFAPQEMTTLNVSAEPIEPPNGVLDEGVAPLAVPEAAKNDVMAFAISQLTQPLVNLVQQAQQLAAATPAPKPVRVQREKRNDITRPNTDNVCGHIWSACDRITEQTGRPATIAELKADVVVAGVNEYTVKTQYARWRAFNGITGRLPKAAKATATPQVVMTHEGNP